MGMAAAVATGAGTDDVRQSPSASSSSQSAKKRKIPADDNDEDGTKAQKASKACLNCRKQKMRCEIDDGPPCRRCRHSKVPCLFKVRANGVEAGDWYISDLGASDAASMELFKTSVLNRLQVIETRLGINQSSRSAATAATATFTVAPQPEAAAEVTASADDGRGSIDETSDARGDDSLPDLWTAMDSLAEQSGQRGHRGWESHIVETLWMAFAEHMPALHFSTHRVFQDRPTPVLLAAVLYAAAMQHPLAEYAHLAPFYRSAASRAIAQLAIPAEDVIVAEERDVDAMHDALGLIILGIMSEAWVTSTGIWIAMAYEKILTGANRSSGPRSTEWRSLYGGLRVIDIEHASLRLSCPLLPLTPPLACLEPSTPTGGAPKNAYTHLMTIMHVGLSHFSSRHLPTLMETVLGTRKPASSAPPVMRPYTADDARIIKGWAKELDSWLLRHHRPPRTPQRGPSEANILLLQYQLHKLFVLSIYHPVRGVDLSKTPVSPERKELLTAARAALQLQRMGLSVWSNWDLVIITLAAMIVLDSLADGVARAEDRRLIQGHINALRTTHQPAPNLRHSLAAKLEARLLALASPAAPATDQSPLSTDLDYLSIFNADAEARVANTLSIVHPAWATAVPPNMARESLDTPQRSAASTASYVTPYSQPPYAAQPTLAPAPTPPHAAPLNGMHMDPTESHAVTAQLDPGLTWLDNSYELPMDIDMTGLSAWPAAFQRVLGGFMLGEEQDVMPSE